MFLRTPKALSYDPTPSPSPCFREMDLSQVVPMKSRRASAILLLAMIVTGSICSAQTVAKRAPDFSLTISTPKSTIPSRGKKTYVPIHVLQKNTSQHTINIGRSSNPAFWYQMTVLLDGNPAPHTELYKRLTAPPAPNAPVIMDFFSVKLKPGKTRDLGVSLSDYYDFSTPGQYQITFARGTDPGQPDNVMVYSNTITVTVLPAPESNNTSPSPNASGITPASTNSQSFTPTNSTTFSPSQAEQPASFPSHQRKSLSRPSRSASKQTPRPRRPIPPCIAYRSRSPTSRPVSLSTDSTPNRKTCTTWSSRATEQPCTRLRP